MLKHVVTTIFALMLVFGGFSLGARTAEADCGKCAAGQKSKICAKCKKAGKKTCSCHKHECKKCKEAGKKCGCKHK
jgi:hypothetical protein